MLWPELGLACYVYEAFVSSWIFGGGCGWMLFPNYCPCLIYYGPASLL